MRSRLVQQYNSIWNLGRRAIGVAILPLGLAVSGNTLLTEVASADIGVNKSFNPISVPTNQKSKVTIELFNSNTIDATGTNFTDNLPSGVTVASPANITNSCGGTVTAVAGASSISLAGGIIPATSSNIGTCQIGVDVVSSSTGTFINTIPVNTVNSSQGMNPFKGEATLVVSPSTPITGSKTFAVANLHGGGSATTMTITLNNSKDYDLTGTGFTDTFPTGLKLATTPTLTNTCGGTLTTSSTNKVILAGGTIPAGGSCNLTVQVQPDVATSFQDAVATNSIVANGVTTTQGISNISAIQGTVTIQRGAQLTQSFAPATIQTGQTSVLTLTLKNFNSTAITAANLTDTLPANLAASSLVSSTCNGTTGTTTVNPGSIVLSGGTIPAAPPEIGFGSCTIQVNVTSTQSGTYTNSIAAGKFNTVNYAATTANLTVQSFISLTKTFAPTTVTQGGQSTVTITLNNSGNSPARITSFTDDLTTMGTGITVAASPATTTTCGGTVNATTGNTTIAKTDGLIPAGTTAVPGSCTITVPISIASTVPAGSKTNTIAIGALQTDKGNNSTAATRNLTVQSPITVSKAFAPSTGVQGGGSTLTITLTNSSTAAANITSFLDSLTTMGTGFTVAASPAPATTCGGTVTVSSGTEITKINGTIPAKSGTKNGSCTITVPVAIAIDAATGARTNTIPVDNIKTGLGNNETATTANLTVNSAVTVGKSFSPATVPIYGTSRLTININRAANAPALTGINLTDTLPNGMSIGSSPNVVSDCGGSVNAIAGSNNISLTGGSLAGGTASSTCSINVNVRAPGTVGASTNTIAANSLVTGQGATYNAAATANLTTTNKYLTLNKSFSPTNITLGQTSKLTILILNNNLGAVDLTAAGITDLLPTGMSIAATPNATFAGTGCTNGTITATPGTSIVLLSGAAIVAGSTCKIEVDVTANFAGNLTNTLPIGTATSAENITNSNNSVATLTLLGTSDLQVTKTNGTNTVTAGGTTTYTIAVKNAGPNNVAGAVLTDNAPTGMTIDSWTCTTSAGSSCAAASGTGNISASVSLLNQGTATFVVSATIEQIATGTIKNTATIITPPTISDTTPANNSASDTDTVLPGHATVVLVKRITAINTTSILTTVNDPTSPNDDSPKWPTPIDSLTGISSFLAGAINGGAVKSGDSVEYTVYFLANGAGDAQQLNLCDFIPSNSTYVSNSLFLAIGAGSPTPISDAVAPVDTDGGFYPNLSTFPSSCSTGTDRGGGAVVVNVGTVNRSLGAGTPPSSYGFIRFRSTVN
jgi:uncharacterized repeat protein (TIGR01451 family)